MSTPQFPSSLRKPIPALKDFLSPVTPQNPTGSSVRYDPLYDDVRLHRQEDDSRLSMGIWKTDLKRAEWGKIEDLCMDALLKKTKDILKHLGTLKSPQQVLIGFALESKDEKAYAIRKLNEKNADAIVMNSIRTPGAGFAVDTNQVTIFEKDGVETAYELKPKEEVAQDIVEKMLTIYRQKFIQ